MKYWGELHSHNDVGYGKGSSRRALSIARTSLDFCAITPHAWWPDLPDNDVRSNHIRGFRRTADRWADTLRLVNSHNTPGKFVTIPAYEWHSLTWGDFCLHFPGSNPRITRASSFDELIKYARANAALVIPHHCAYPVGRRGTNWSAIVDHELPLAEIFSEHGSSLDSPSPFSMYGHSMGGNQRSQTVLYQLRRGRRMGFLAGTDNHYGHPGAYNEGLTAVYADKLDREHIFQALRNANTYAVTGDRIDVEFRAHSGGSEGIPGDRLEADGAIQGMIEVTGRAPLEQVEVLKNGATRVPVTEVYRANTPQSAERSGFVRFEWGWDGLGSFEVSEWDMSFKLKNGEFLGIEPCFCSGPHTSELTPRIERIADDEVRVISHSSRTNPRPVQGIIFKCNAADDAEWRLSVGITRGGEHLDTYRTVSMKSIEEDDMYIGVSQQFNFPSMKVHAVAREAETRIAGTWEDSDARAGDFYFARVVQRNGQRAWTSPIWCE